MADENLRAETADALLWAIRDAAPTANDRGTEALESLAKAYAAVVEGMPKRSGRVGAIA